MVTFNVVSAILGTKGAGAGLRGGGAAAQASQFAVVAKAGAGAVRAGEFIAKMPTRHRPGRQGDRASSPASRSPTSTSRTSTPRPPHVDIPSGGRPGQSVLPDGVIDQRIHDVAPTPAGGSSVGDAVGNGARDSLPPSATLTPDGVVDGRVFDPPTPNAPDGPPLVQDGVIGGGRGVDTPATPSADAPGTSTTPDAVGERTLPPSATLTPDGVVDGRVFDPPTPNAPDGPPLVRDGVIGGGRGVDAPATPAPHGAEVPARADVPEQVPARTPEPALVGAPERSAVGAGTGRGLDAPVHAGVPERPIEVGGGGARGGFDGPTAHTPDTPARGGADAPPARGIDTPAPARGAEVPVRAGVPDQPVSGGGRGGGFDTPPARPDVPTGGGRGGGFDADPPVGRGVDAPDAPDAPTGRHEPTCPVDGTRRTRRSDRMPTHLPTTMPRTARATDPTQTRPTRTVRTGTARTATVRTRAATVRTARTTRPERGAGRRRRPGVRRGFAAARLGGHAHARRTARIPGRARRGRSHRDGRRSAGGRVPPRRRPPTSGGVRRREGRRVRVGRFGRQGDGGR